MSHLIRATLAVTLTFGMAATASAVTVRDLVALSRAGLGDDILLAVLEADPTEFELDADTIIALRREGISERVLRAMLVAPEAPAPADDVSVDPFPGLVIIGSSPSIRPRVSTVIVPVPIFGFGAMASPPRCAAPRPRDVLNDHRGFGRFMNDGFRDVARRAGGGPKAGR